jgi:stage II sporulation protein P
MNLKDDYRLKVCMLAMTLFLVIILPSIVRANSYNSSTSKKNMFYVEVLNYTMPLIKATSFSGDNITENGTSFEQIALSLFGLDLRNPMSVIGKELSFISADTSVNGNSNLNVTFNQFKLNDNQISKNNKNTTPSSSDKLNLPNKVVSVYDPTLKKTLNTSVPEVLIYHTHTTESYSPGKPNSFDDTKNVVAVGDALINELESKYGISGINDRTVHDAVAYTQSYARSAITLDKYLAKYKDFKLIIDLHRDSVEDKKAMTVKFNGENVARFALVMCRKNPHFDKNMIIANKIVQTSEKLFPGLCEGVIYYDYGTRFFNQDKSNNAVLIEVGSDINTTDEAKATAKYLARIIAEILNK